VHAVLKKVLAKLDKAKEERPKMNAICFPAKGQSIAYARGESMTVETTALTVLAMVKNGQFPNQVNKAMTYLLKTREGGGHWGSPQATILALKALIAAAEGQKQKGTTPFVVKVNGKKVAEGKVTEKNADVLQQFDLREYVKVGKNTVAIETKGETGMVYQIVGRHYLPHTKVKE